MFGMAQGTGYGFGAQQGLPGYGIPQGQSQFGLSPFGGSPFGQPQIGQPPLGQPPIGQAQFGQPQFGQALFGQSQSPIQVLPVVTPQGWVGVLVLTTLQPIPVGIGLQGPMQVQAPWATGRLGAIGGYLPLQVQQQMPSPYSPLGLTGAGGVGGQPLGYGLVH